MRKRGAIEAAIDVEVPFHDVDLAQIVWHGNYLKYLESARWAVMDRLGFGLKAMLSSGYLWPIIDVQMRCIKATRFQDRLNVRASLVEWESRLTFNYLITQVTSGERVARARTTQVAIQAQTHALQLVTPDVLRDCILAYLDNNTPARFRIEQRS